MFGKSFKTRHSQRFTENDFHTEKTTNNMMEIQKVIHNLCTEQNQKDFNSSVLLNSEYKLLG